MVSFCAYLMTFASPHKLCLQSHITSLQLLVLGKERLEEVSIKQYNAGSTSNSVYLPRACCGAHSRAFEMQQYVLEA